MKIPVQYREEFKRDSTRNAKRTWLILSFLAGLSTALALGADLQNISQQHHSLAYLSRGITVLYFVLSAIVTLVRPQVIATYYETVILLAFFVICGTVIVLGPLAGGVGSLYFFGIIQAEIGAALFFPVRRLPLAIFFALANIACIWGLIAFGPSMTGDQISNLVLTLVICAALLLGGHHAISNYRESSFLDRMALSESEQEIQTLLTSIHDIFMAVDAQYRIQFYNDSAASLFRSLLPNYRSFEGENFVDLFPRLIDNSQLVANIDRVLDTGESIVFEEYYPLLGKHLMIRAYPSANGVSLLGSDITDRVVSEEAERARNLGIRLESAREEERRRVSRNIHDQLGQSLAALKLDLKLAQKNLASDRPLGSQLSSMEDNIETSIMTTRQIASELHPAMLDDLGLTEALEWLVQGMAERAGWDFRIRIDAADDQIPSRFGTTIYRIVQEALTNIMKHAEANSVSVELRCADEYVELVVRDDGVGIDIPDGERSPRSGLGLVSMQERAHEHGGTVEFRLGHDGGTVIRTYLPLAGSLA